MALDVTGLREVSSDFDTEGLTRLDTSGLTAIDDPMQPLRLHSKRNAEQGTTVTNDDGSVSSVRSGSIEDQRINQGRPTLIPFVWDGRIVEGSEAIERAISSGEQWPSFDSNEAATEASIRLSSSLDFPVNAPSADQPDRGWTGNAADLGRSIWDAVVYHTPAAAAAFLEGDQPFADDDWKDDLIARARKRAQDRQFQSESIQALGPSLGFSVTSAVTGIAAGLAATAGSGPVIGFAAGGAASGLTAYRISTNQFVRDLYAAANEEQRFTSKRSLTKQEFAAKQQELSDVIENYGLWEAVPEGAANVVGFGILKVPVKSAIGSIFGKNVLTRLATKMGALYGSELATETVTQTGQQRAEVEAGITPGAAREFTSGADWADSFEEIAGPVLLQTTIMAGGAKAGMLAYDAIARRSPPQDGSEEDTFSADEVRAFASKRQADLEGAPSLEPIQQQELDMLRGEGNNVESIASQYGIKLEPTGEVEAAAAATPPLSQSDIDSPIPDDLIQEGHEILQEALGAQSANEILQEAGLPSINRQVLVAGDQAATIVDAYEQDGVRGVKIRYEDGRTESVPFNEIRGRFTPIAEQADAKESQTETAQQTPAEEQPAAQETRRAAEPASEVLNEDLKARGEPVVSSIDAQRRWSEGDTIYAFHEQDEAAPTEVTSIEMLRSFTPDQLLALPVQAPAIKPIEEAPALPPEAAAESSFAEREPPKGPRVIINRVTDEATPSAQFENYQSWIAEQTPEALAQAPGVLEQIKVDERLNDGESQQLEAAFNERMAVSTPSADAQSDIDSLNVTELKDGDGPIVQRVRPLIEAARQDRDGAKFRAINAEVKRIKDPATRAIVSKALLQAGQDPALAEDAGVEEGAADRLAAIKQKLVVLASGMSRTKDFEAGAHAWGGLQSRGIGVDVGELSRPGIQAIARAVVDKNAQVFIDSGAFTLFRRNIRRDESKALDFDAIFSRYEQVLEAIENYNQAENDIQPPLLVMPDVIGDQAASLALIDQYQKQITTETQFSVSRPIVPIQKGDLSLAEAYRSVVEKLGTSNFIVGVPANKETVTIDEFREFISEAKPTRLHFLGAVSDKRLGPYLRVLASANITLDHISADANILRSALYGRQDPQTSRGAAIVDTLTDRAGQEFEDAVSGRRLFVEFGNQRAEVQSFGEATTKWNAFRDRTGEGASNLPRARIVDENGELIARISYNGKILPVKPTKELEATVTKAKIIPTRAGVVAVPVDEPVTVPAGPFFRGTSREIGGMSWWTTSRAAAKEYSDLDDGGRIERQSTLKLSNPATSDTIREVLLDLGEEVPRDVYYYHLSLEQYARADEVIAALKARGHDGVYLRKGEDFAPNGGAIESVLMFDGVVAAPIEEKATSTQTANPVSGTPLEKAEALHALAREINGDVDRALTRIDSELGFTSKSDFKTIDKIISKSERYSFIRKHGADAGVEQVHDAFRFKSVVAASDVAGIERAVEILLEETGATIDKLDFEKMTEANNEWGWRVLPVDLRMPNGLIVEYYFPLTEVEAAKKERGHDLFEKWRDANPDDLKGMERLRYDKDAAESKRLYDAAFQSSAESADLSATELMASFASLEASVLSNTGIQASASSAVVSVPTGGTQTPSSRTTAGPPSGRQITSTTSGSSRNLYTRPSIDESVPPSETKPSQDVTIQPRKEAESGVQTTLPSGDARTGAEDVQPAPQDRGAGRSRAEEVGGSARDARRADEGRTEAQKRVAGATAAEPGRESGLGDADRVPERQAGTDGSADRQRSSDESATADSQVRGENFAIEPGSLAEDRGPTQKARDNIRAIELVREIEATGRPATHEDQVALARYVGWGGLKGAFPNADGHYGKGFEKVGAQLKELLSDTEYATARRSLQYAHFTAENVVNTMWEAVRRLGFEGGKVFEPGMGVGNFAGLMPADVAVRTDYSGLELDHTTARIARLLYPRWGVRQDDFTRSPLPEDTFDLVIGNPPFADVPIKSDPKYPQGFLLHDYFFAKSLDSVRPGGLLAFISSAGTMNKQDSKAREYFADRADLVGAIRLPGDAFKKNAGTEVTTDILFFRKRLPDERAEASRDWVQTVEVTLPDKEGFGRKGLVNRYFQEHPEMVLGEQGFFDKLYPGRYAVRAPRQVDKALVGGWLDAALAKAVDTLPQDIMSEWLDTTERAEIDFGTAEHKDGSYYLKDGVLMQRRDGVGRPLQRRGKGVKGGKTLAEFERIKALIPVRDALRSVYEADLAKDSKASTKARARLNASYDAFVAKFGAINKAKFTYQRPSIVEMEGLRAAAREEARYIGKTWREGTFDSAKMTADGATLAQIARARKAARAAAEEANRPFDEGSFDHADVPDKVLDKRPNIDPFIDDPENYRLRAIEKYQDSTGEHSKTAVFERNVISLDREPDIQSINDALLWVLNQKGRLDIPELARVAKLSNDEAIEQLGDGIYRVPGTDNQWEIAGRYLSGNVRRKLRMAKAAAERDPDLQRNVDALEAVQPIALPPSEIGANLGMPWIPTDVIEAFGTDSLGLDRLQVQYLPVLSQWTVKGDESSAASRTTWGTEDRPAPSLLQDALNRQTPKVYRETRINGKTARELDPVATEAVQQKILDIKERFSEWIWSDTKRADTLANLYNEEYNSLVVRETDGSYLTTPGVSASWNWRPHQSSVIARIIQDGNTYMAHAVGSGKTSAMIGAGMEMRRLGLARKPMYAVPNHMLAQFTKEFYETYPTAKIAVADERQFHMDRRKQFIANVANEDLDAIVITHSAFGMIPVSDPFQDGLIQEQLDQYRELLEDPDLAGQENRITRGRLEKQIERLEQRLSGKATKRRDQVFTFEEMGVDFLFLDEAHLFRKLDFATKMTSVKGVSPEGSKASFDLYVKTRYLETINPGRNLVLASGTPVTNTMAELYTVSRYLQPHELEDRSLTHFDAWAGAFGDTKSELEQNAAGGYQSVTRFAKFVNVPELSNMVRQNMDVVTSAELDQYVTRPAIKGGGRKMNLAEKTPELEEYQAALDRRLTAIRNRRGPPKKGDDIMLTVINDGRHAAIDMRLVDPDRYSNDPGSKLNLLIDNVYRTWEETKRQPFYGVVDGGYGQKPIDTGPATQMVFANLGLSGARGFAVPDYIRSELVRRGVPRDDIAFISEHKTHMAKQRLFNDMNEGKVRILIGSTAKMATGVNVQRRLAAIHNLDPLWYPADDEQRIGRGLRQGNMNREIEIQDYSTKGTYDSTMWGLMETKARFIEAFFRGDPTLRDMDDLGESSQYAQAKAITTADPRLITLTERKQELEKAERQKAAFSREIYASKRRVANAKDEIAYYSKRVPLIEQDIAQRTDIAGEAFVATLEGNSYTDRVEFGDLLLGQLDLLVSGKKKVDQHTLGTIGGFDIDVSIRKSGSHFYRELTIARAGGYVTEIRISNHAVGVVRSLENALGRFESFLTDAKQRIADGERTIREFSGQTDKEFTGQDEIDRLIQEVREIEAELAPPPVEEPEQTETPPDDPTEQFSLSPDVVDRAEAIEADLKARLDKVGIADRISLKLVDAIFDKEGANVMGARGRFSNRAIEIALSTKNKRRTLDHEIIHAMRSLGLIRAAEWKALSRAARADKPLMTMIRARYEGLSKEKMTEEAIAEMHANWSSGIFKPKGFIRTAFNRIRTFFEAVGNAFRGAGFQSARDIFQRIGRGEVGARGTTGAANKAEAFQQAFHGTPHKFDEFSTDKIGTGEGAQAYGHGLYFAENKGVAQSYAQDLAGLDINLPGVDSGVSRQLGRDFQNSDFDSVDDITDDFYEAAAEGYEADGFPKEAAQIRAADKDKAVLSSGSFYEVNIPDAAVAKMLDWDAPLSEQSESVRKALREIMGDLDIQKVAGSALIEPGLSITSTRTGGDVYRRVVSALTNTAASVDNLDAGPRAASEALNQAGIPGIKYYDALSRGITGGGGFLKPLADAARGKDKRARNLVVFDASIVTIKKVDGVSVGEEAFALGPEGRPVKRKPVPAFENEESELRWIEARKGVRNLDTWWQRRMADIDRVKNGFSRHFINLPNEARFSQAREQLRKIEAAPQASKEEVVRTLRQITNGMNRADMDLFTRKVVLDDLSFEVDQQHQLPFGFTPATVRSELAKLDRLIEDRPDIQEKIKVRQAISVKIANDLVRAGVLHEEQIKNPAYYRHQVLDYARAQVAYAKGAGNKLKTPHWARRMGSRLDINANLLEAEFEWMQKALTDIATAKTIEWFKSSEYNVRDDVIANAKAHNERLVSGIIERDIRENGYMKNGTQTSPINEEWRKFRQRIAFGLKQVREAIESGEMGDIPFEFRSTAEHLLSETQGETSLFPFLAWILDNNKTGSMGAAMAFKAVNQRKAWIRTHLGERYADPMQLDNLVKRGFAPPGHMTWQPDEGRLLFTAKTIPEHVVDRMLDRIADEGAGPISSDELRGALESVRSMLAVGGPKYQMVLPEEVAKSLGSINDQHADGLFDALFATPLSWWKRWVLINPRRVLKYNLNNLSGDIDAVIAGNPKAIKRMPQAIKELYRVMIKGETPSDRYREAVDRGVFDSGLTIQEIPDINYMSEFEGLINPPSLKEPGRLAAKPFMKIWRNLQRYTWFRENWLRYAAYLDYVDRLEAGESMRSIGYGAAHRPMVDAIDDHKDRAALLARELVGDYGAISEFGKGIRRKIIPFYSWMEINTKRYWRLGANAWDQGVGQGFRATGMIGASLGVRTTAYLTLRMAMLYGLVQLWNNLAMGDEEDELGAEARARLHVILGRDENGDVVTLRIQGALSDFLDWFGLDDAVGMISEIERGRADYNDLLVAMAKAPVNKVAGGITPLIKMPLELALGQSYWPDVFRPRTIRDRWQHLTRLFSLEHEYDLIFDRPSRGFARSLLSALVYRRDVGQSAYGRIKGMSYDWQRRVKGTSGSGYQSPRSTALYNWRRAKKFGDRAAERAAMRRMRELGISDADIRSSIRRAHPLGGLSIRDRGAFLRTLSKREREVLKDAIAWYEETYL